MTIKTLASKGVPTRQLGLDESIARYHRKRIEQDNPDGLAQQRRLASKCSADIEHWRQAIGNERNTAVLHKWPFAECGYIASPRSLQRYVAERYSRPIGAHGGASRRRPAHSRSSIGATSQTCR